MTPEKEEIGAPDEEWVAYKMIRQGRGHRFRRLLEPAPGRFAMFLLIGICFLLPFFDVSCSGEFMEQYGGRQGFAKDTTVRFSGTDLVLGTNDPEVVGQRTFLGEGSPVRTPAEPFAIIAFASAIAGLVMAVTIWDMARPGLIASLVGAGSLGLLATSPTLAWIGTGEVGYRYGYWLTLGLFLVSTALHAWLYMWECRIEGTRIHSPPPNEEAVDDPE